MTKTLKELGTFRRESWPSTIPRFMEAECRRQELDLVWNFDLAVLRVF